MSIDPITTQKDGNATLVKGPISPKTTNTTTISESSVTKKETLQTQKKVRRGQTVVRQKALVRVAGLVTADTLGVSAKNVKVSIHDDGARLGLELETPLSEADMQRCALRPDMTLFSLCENARQTIAKRAEHITGHSIGDVNVIVAGVEKQPEDTRRVE